MKAADLHIFDVFSLNLRLRLRSLFNPFTALLAAPSLEKRSNLPNFKGAKFEIIKAFCPLRLSTRKDFYQNVLKVEFLQDHQTYCLEACMSSLFSPEIFTGRGSEGVNISHEEILPMKCAQESHDNKSQNPKPLVINNSW